MTEKICRLICGNPLGVSLIDSLLQVFVIVYHCFANNTDKAQYFRSFPHSNRRCSQNAVLEVRPMRGLTPAHLKP